MIIKINNLNDGTFSLRNLKNFTITFLFSFVMLEIVNILFFFNDFKIRIII